MAVKDCKNFRVDTCLFPRNQYRAAEGNLPDGTKEIAVKYFKKFRVYNSFLPRGKKLLIQTDSKKLVSQVGIQVKIY